MALEQGAGDDRRILLIDCGLMFPGPDLHGIDLVLPDFTYLRENADRIDALVATHGHEDHVGGLQFLLREISFPIYGSALTLGTGPQPHRGGGTARADRADPGRRRRATTDRHVRRRVHPGHPQRPARPRHRRAHAAGRDPRTPATSSSTSRRSTTAAPTSPASASWPRPTASACCWPTRRTPRRPGTRRASAASAASCARLFAEHAGRRIITASFASHLHRIQQIADAAIASGRKVATLGLSMRKNVQLGLDLGMLHIPASSLIDIEDIDRYPPGEVCVISTGLAGRADVGARRCWPAARTSSSSWPSTTR